MKYIYKVKCHFSILTENGNMMCEDDGSLVIFTDEIGIFTNLKKAEKFIKSYAKDQSDTTGVIGFNVEKRAVDVGYRGIFNTICHFDARYSYDKYGNRFCSSEYDDGCEIKFHGRSEDIHFNKNDIAICIQSDSKADLVVVVNKPISKCKGGDYSDDCYTVVGIPVVHFHPQVTELFPVIGEIDAVVQNKLKKRVEEYNLNGF